MAKTDKNTKWAIRTEGADGLDGWDNKYDYYGEKKDRALYNTKAEGMAALWSYRVDCPDDVSILVKVHSEPNYKTLLERVTDVQLEISNLDHELQVRSNRKIHYALRGTVDFLETIRQGLIEEAK